MTFSSTWHKSCRPIFDLKIKINGLLSDPLTVVMSVFLQNALSKFVSHFNDDNDKVLKVYRKMNKKSKWQLYWSHQLFLRLHQQLFQTQEGFYSKTKLSNKKQALSLIKRFWRKHIHKLIYSQSLRMKCLYHMKFSFLRFGREYLMAAKQILLKTFTKASN